MPLFPPVLDRRTSILLGLPHSYVVRILHGVGVTFTADVASGDGLSVDLKVGVSRPYLLPDDSVEVLVYHVICSL